jgi:Domain of unknown function (DUF4249)
MKISNNKKIFFFMKNHQKSTVFAAILMLLQISCVDKIDLKTSDPTPPGVMLQGKMELGNPIKIRIKMAELKALRDNLPRPLGGFNLTLLDDLGNSAPINSSGDGTYFLDIDPNNTAFLFESGRKFKVSAKLGGGQTYETMWETVVDAPAPDSISIRNFEKEVKNFQGVLIKKPHFRFLLHTPILDAGGEKLHYRWTVEQAYKITDFVPMPNKTCFAIRPLLSDLLLLFNANTTNLTRLDAFPIAETLIDYRFSEGFYLNVFQESLTENAFGYFDELNQLLSKKGTLFDPPAGEIRSNLVAVSDPTLPTYGFFYVTKPSVIRIYVSPADAGNQQRYCPLPPPISPPEMPPPPTPCDDCLNEFGAQLSKPIWWLF